MAPAATGTATIKNDFFHPQHFLTRYSEAPSYPCAACERVVTGTGYRCDECNFNIHEACLTLQGSMSFDQHRKDHLLTLTHLGAFSRCCDVCKITSFVGSYMYQCGTHGARPCWRRPMPPSLGSLAEPAAISFLASESACLA
jgi:hypothetical protein